MNDLDRRIAEAKGRRIDMLGGIETTMPGIYELGPTWSTSDTKAFELVDEIDHHFALERGLSSDTEAWEWEWRAGFMLGAEIRMHAAPTRPEAICRAYLAAMEWMKGRKG
jgi:hypothetical protein